MSAEYRRINRFGFAEHHDMTGVVREADLPVVAETLRRIVDLVLVEDESGIIEAMSPEAEADFAVPLGMAADMLEDGGYSDVELVPAACTVRYFAERHANEFPGELTSPLRRLPR